MFVSVCVLQEHVYMYCTHFIHSHSNNYGHAHLQPPLAVYPFQVLHNYTLHLFCLPLVPVDILSGSALHALDRQITFEPTLHIYSCHTARQPLSGPEATAMHACILEFYSFLSCLCPCPCSSCLMDPSLTLLSSKCRSPSLGLHIYASTSSELSMHNHDNYLFHTHANCVLSRQSTWTCTQLNALPLNDQMWGLLTCTRPQ